jgi:uncharacterized membrane protein
MYPRSNWTKIIAARSNWTRPVLISVMILYQLTGVVLGIDIPGSVVLRPVIGFVLLTVLPGYLLILLLGLGDRSLGRIAIYSVGLSLPVVVILSITINVVLSTFTIDRPLSPWSLTVAGSALVLGLSAVRYAGFESSARPTLSQLSLSNRDRIAFVLVSLLPVYSVLVTVFTSTKGFNGLLIALLCSLSMVPLLLWRWQGSPALYPYAIWAVAASVLLQMTLVSGHLWGFDIHFEYFTAAKIFENGYWNPGWPDASNSLVMITLLAAVYSMVTGLDIVLVYKIIYPLLVSLLPLGIWYIVESEFADRSVAMLAPFALVFYYGFFKTMPDKQEVAGLFAVFLLVVFLDRKLSATQRWVLGLAFAVALTFSHYGVSLLFVGFLAFALVARYVVQAVTTINVSTRITRPSLVGFLSAFWVVWYLLTASGVNFYRVVAVGYEMIESLPFPMSERSGVAYATTGFESGYWIAYKFIYIILLGLIGVGIVSALYVIYTDRDAARSTEYTLFSAGVFCFLVLSVVFTFGMGFDRTLQIALFVVSPFAIVGSKAAASFASWLAARLPNPNRLPNLKIDLRACIDSVPIEGLFAVFLAVLFLFSSGTVFALADQQVPPYNINLDEDAGWPVYSQSEVAATRWLETHVSDNATVAVYNNWEHIKSRDGLLVSEVVPPDELESIWLSRTSLDGSAYVYVSHEPMKKLNSGTEYEYIAVRKTPFYKEILSEAEVVYRDDNVSIYYISISAMNRNSTLSNQLLSAVPI